MSTAMITIEGFAARDAELKFTPNGRAVLEVTVPITPQKKNDQGGWDDVGETAWYRCALWGSQAESTQIAKGSLVQIVGALKPRTWEKDGKTGTSLEVTVKSIGILREPKGASGSSGGHQRPTNQQVNSGPKDDPWGTGGGGNADPSEPPFAA